MMLITKYEEKSGIQEKELSFNFSIYWINNENNIWPVTQMTYEQAHDWSNMDVSQDDSENGKRKGKTVSFTLTDKDKR